MRSIIGRQAALPVATLLAVGLLAACAGTAAPSPSASAAPSTAPSVEPSAAPSTEPSASPSESAATEATEFEVPLTIATAHTVVAKVVDWTGRITGATSGAPGDGASVAIDAVQLANDGPTTLVVTWAAGPCDSTPSLVFDADRSKLTVIQEPCTGDAIAFDRIVRLTTSEAVDAATITGVLQPGGDTPG